MKPISQVTFQWLMQTVKGEVNLLETYWFSHGWADMYAHQDSGRLFLDRPSERITVKEVLDRLAEQSSSQTLGLCSLGQDLTVRPISDMGKLIEKKMLTEKLDLIQILPIGYHHTYFHRIRLTCVNNHYQSSYFLLLKTGENILGTNERYYRKLKAEASRLVHVIELSTELRVEQVEMTFVMGNGEMYLQNIRDCVLVPDYLLGSETERIRKNRMGFTVKGPCKPRSTLASPLRIHTPALTSPNSPVRKTTEEDLHFPTLPSPRSVRGFNPNFKELLLKTMAKKRLSVLRRAAPFPLSSIEEVRRDDDRFFEMMGLVKPAVKTVSDICLSTASTNESAEIYRLGKRKLTGIRRNVLFSRPQM